MSIIKRIQVSSLLLVLLAAPLSAWARVKLITLPVRERVEIQLDHPGVTLVEEERIVPLVKGKNVVDFSWAYTRIDAESLVFRVLGPANGDNFDVSVLSVSYPPNENALIWNVYSAKSAAVKVRISYVLGNLRKRFSYRAVATPDEKSLTLAQYLHIENYANEEYGSTGIWAGYGDGFLKPIGINETKKILMAKDPNVAIRKTYTVDLEKHGYLDAAKKKLRVPMHYVLKNDKGNGLGKVPLAYGKARLFQDDGRGGTAFIGEDWGKFTPLDDEMTLYLGVAQDISVKRTIERNNRKRIAANLYSYDVIVKYEIENFKNKQVQLDIVENIRKLRESLRGNNGREVEWELGDKTTFKAGIDKEKSSFERPQFNVMLPAKKDGTKATRVIHKLHVVMTNEW